MKLFRTLFILALTALILTTSVSAYTSDTLNYLGMLPPGAEEGAVVTREYLAYSLANMLIPNAELHSTDTAFSDVGTDNIYSGYIKFVSERGIMTGGGDGYFRPKEPVGMDAVSKTLVSALGYNLIAEAKGGWPYGYTSVASALKLYRGIDTETEQVTYGVLRKMLINALNVKLPNEKYYMEDGSLSTELMTSSGNGTIAKENYKLTEYKGIITYVSAGQSTAEVTVTDAKSESALGIGDKVKLSVWEGVNISFYKNIPVNFVVYDDKLIVDVAFSDDVVVKFGVVDSVNNEYKDVSYSTKHINSITVLDDEKDYEFASDCVFTRNSENFSGTIDLMGRFVRIAAEDDEIISLETWDFTDVGGIITEAGTNFLSYTAGNDEKRLDKIDDAEEKLVVIDGEIRSYKELKAGMVFSYYRDAKNDLLVISATERTLTDTLSSYSASDKTLSLGSLDVGYADNIYFSEDGVRYTKGIAAISDYYNLDVTVRLDIYGKAVYVTKYSGDKANQKFMGYLLGIDAGKAFKGQKARIAKLDDGSATKTDYDMAKTITYGEGLDASVVETSIGTTDGSALYEIELNAKGEVKGFYKLKEYEGFEGQSWSGIWGSFIEHGNPYLVVNGKKLFIPGQTPVLCIHDDGGEVEFYNIKYQSLVGKECNDKISLKFYGYEDAPELKLVVMVGNVNVVSGNRGMGVVESLGVTFDENGEEVNCITVNGTSYVIKDGSVSGIEKGNFVSYTVSLFETDSVIVEEVFDLKDSFQNWDGKTFGQISYKYGHIQKSDRLKITLEGSVDGSLCYYYENVKFYGVDDDGKLSILSYKDLNEGMEVVIGIETGSNGGASVTEVFVRKN